MKESKTSNIIPGQQTGKAIDAESHVALPNESAAKTFFAKVKDRLKNVNRWDEYAGNFSATFRLVNASGIEVNRHVEKGDYFKIDIPGPGSESGKGYDWVRVEEIENNATTDGEKFGLRVRPTENPQGGRDDVAHFYSDESTSTFLVERKGNTITASIHDRNTKPNTEASTTADKIRDTAVGAAGVLAFSKIQWQKLTDGLLEK
jgi:hypothetical protein